MSFHDATFRLLGSSPRVSAPAQQRLVDAQDRLGIVFPAAVREWYEREHAIRVLADHSNEDPPIELANMEVVTWQSKTLVPIRHENQGVCTWAVEVDGSEDPAVFVDVDSGGKQWVELAPSFSSYVYSCVWDYGLVLNQAGLVQAQNRPLSQDAIGVLSDRLAEESKTYGWPGSAQFRFRGRRFAVLIWNSERQSDWFVGAADRESLRTGVDMVWEIDDVGESLYDCSDIGHDVLSEIRSRAN